MNLRIISTTDGRYLGEEFNDDFPITLGGYVFFPSEPAMYLGNNVYRFYNSNYSIDAEEI